MYLRTLLILAMIAALSVFAAINWHAFTTPATLSLAFTTVEAPLGLILLGFVALLTFLFLVYLVYLQSSALFEWRRHARELQAQRELAENAEASRFNQLQSLLEAEAEKLAKQVEEVRSVTVGRLEQMDRELRSQIEQSVNTLGAYIDELEDRFEKLKRRESSDRDDSQ
jgi:uncharacterized integral membrane protein